MTKTKAWAIFHYWFEQHGHWMFGVKGKPQAVEAWSGRGIDGLPDYPGPE